MARALALAVLAMAATSAAAAPMSFDIESHHTFPSFTADHMGLSLWRGKFNHTTGTVRFDEATGTGTVDVTVDAKSIDTGHDELNQHLVAKEWFDVATYPTARYTGRIEADDGKPARIVGELTMRGQAKPLTLTIRQFKCIDHPYYKARACGADAGGAFQRDAYGLDGGKEYGFDMRVDLDVSIEMVEAGKMTPPKDEPKPTADEKAAPAQ